MHNILYPFPLKYFESSLLQNNKPTFEGLPLDKITHRNFEEQVCDFWLFTWTIDLLITLL